jgi:acetyl-CoA carboxylase biotin carboxyl carrier protein
MTTVPPEPPRVPKFDLDTDFIERLAELIHRTGLTEIEIAQGDLRVRVARQIQAVIEAGAYPRAETAPPPAPAPAAEAAAEAPHPGTLTSPMVGTVFLAPDPGSPQFVAVGDEVKEGQTLLIIEAMKVMNSIRAPRSGKVTRIFVQNAAPVEYGEPLLIVE